MITSSPHGGRSVASSAGSRCGSLGRGAGRSGQQSRGLPTGLFPCAGVAVWLVGMIIPDGPVGDASRCSGARRVRKRLGGDRRVECGALDALRVARTKGPARLSRSQDRRNATPLGRPPTTPRIATHHRSPHALIPDTTVPYRAAPPAAHVSLTAGRGRALCRRRRSLGAFAGRRACAWRAAPFRGLRFWVSMM